jgi:hypothetical protein
VGYGRQRKRSIGEEGRNNKCKTNVSTNNKTKTNNNSLGDNGK